MRTLMTILAGILAVAASAAPVHRNGYIRKDGTYVSPSYSTRSNRTKLDNFSSQGNYNPYSGKTGTVDPYKQTYPGSSYGSTPNRRKTNSSW